MAKIPYLVRRKNIFYFRLVIPVELRESVNAREIIQSLKTENRQEATHLALKLAAHFKASLHDLKTGKAQQINHLVLFESRSKPPIAPPVQVKSSAPLLSVVISDFLKRYNPNNKATLTKLRKRCALTVSQVLMDFFTQPTFRANPKAIAQNESFPTESLRVSKFSSIDINSAGPITSF